MAKHKPDYSFQADMPLGEGSQAKFNMGLAYLQRIDVLIQNVNYFSLKRDYKNMKLFLDRFYSEVKPELTPDEIIKSNLLKIKTIRYYNPNLIINYNGFWDDIEEYEDYLRMMLKKHNMQMPEMADPSMAAYG